MPARHRLLGTVFSTICHDPSVDRPIAARPRSRSAVEM